MLAPIADGDTTQWNVMEWAFEQAQYLTPVQHHVLLYLSAHAFYQEDNAESGEVGQVLRRPSYVASMVAGTNLNPRTIRRALVALQMKAYIKRETRQDRGIHGQQPHLIYVLWEGDADVFRAGLREGKWRLTAELMAVPSRPPSAAPLAPVINLVKGGLSDH